MATRRPLTQFVESCRFWDVVTLWARERLEHEQIVAAALDHLLGIVNRAEAPVREKLSEEFILRKDFRAWLIALDLRLPTFWFRTVMSRGQ